jgi:3'-phosphoadenosine 5'-phosphosulfate (PAPS) 3'-phosphatase
LQWQTVKGKGGLVTENWQRDPAASARLLEVLTDLASQAAAAIMAVRSPGVAWRAKEDASPVTAADEAAQAVILEGLRRHLPGLPPWSIHSTAPRNSSPGLTTSRSISRSFRTGGRVWEWSEHRPWV